MNQDDAPMRLTRRRLGALAAVLLAFPARASGRHDAGDERFRPRIHYAPPSGFMDDPNGLIFHDGEYHLFYQFNPAEPKAANFHWGHAVSSDLLHWRTLPVVLEPTPQGMPFSGSAVFDQHNSSGLFAPGEAGLVAIYTRASAARQAQAIAFSTDGGRSFTDNPGNPVLDVGSDEFRDPKVMWHEPTRRWVMAVARPREHRVLFYGSDDLMRWQELGEFGGAGLLGTDYECPNLVEVPLEGGGSRWVLFVSTNPGAPLGGGAVQYFVGTFDGRRFVAEDSAMRLADFGQDFYSLQIYADVAGPPLAVAWMGNWLYCNDVPATPSRGAMALPRRLSLRRRGDDWRLLQAPVSLDPIAGRTLLSQRRVSGTGLLAQAALPPGEAVEIVLRIEAERGAAVTLRVCNAQGEVLVAGFATAPYPGFLIDRSGTRGFRNRWFTGQAIWSAPPGTTTTDLRVILDRTSIELIGAGGEASGTMLQFFSAPPDRLEILADGAAATLLDLTARTLRPSASAA